VAELTTELLDAAELGGVTATCAFLTNRGLAFVLAAWATQRKRSVGRRVPKTEVVRVLIEVLLADPSLAARVEEQLRET
jgi:hypothetical protein